MCVSALCVVCGGSGDSGRRHSVYTCVCVCVCVCICGCMCGYDIVVAKSVCVCM